MECLDFRDETCDNYLRLLTLLYADDTLVLSNSSAGLQKALNELNIFCKQWKLQINSSKTKIIVFSKRKPRKMPNFSLENSTLEIVHEFKYLGVIFKSNGNFNNCKIHLKEQALKAMFALLSKGRVLHLPVDVMLDLFDKTVLPIMLYGCEVWGFGNNSMLDVVFLKFCKYLLGLKASTPNCMVYGEVGGLPVSVNIERRMVGYWMKLATLDDTRICKKLYNVMLHWYENDSYQSKWLSTVKDILINNELDYVWQTQGMGINQGFVKNEVKERLRSRFIQDWKATMFHSSKCTLYKEIKSEFGLEPYLCKLPKNVWKYIIKFRFSNHKLSIETGRYTGVVRDTRYCEKCTLHVKGDEYHLFFDCTNTEVVKNRRRFIPLKLTQNRSMHNFVNLMKMVTDMKIAKRISSFVKLCDIV